MSESVYGISEDLILLDIQAQISGFHEQLPGSKDDLAGAKGALERIQIGISKWSIVKQKGIEGFPEFLQTDAHKLVNILKSYGIFLVPVGGA